MSDGEPAKGLPDLYVRGDNGRYQKLPTPLVMAVVKFNGESLLAGFDVSLSGHLADVDAEKITFAVTKGVTDILDLFNRFEKKLSEMQSEIDKKDSTHD